MANLSDFREWLLNHVTKVVRQINIDRVESLKEDWVHRRWVSLPLDDAYYQGYAAGLLDAFNVDEYFEEGDNEL